MRHSVKVVGRRTAAALAVTAFVAGSWLGTAGPAGAVGPADWPAFLGGPAHTSHTADPVITPANAPTLAQKWHFNIPYVSSPVVADGSVFIGSFAGWFYKINAVKGLLQKKIFLGFQPKRTCAAFGFASTATVARDPKNGKDMVYVAAPDGYLHAFDAVTMQQRWRSAIAIPSTKVNDYLQWSSPTVAHGRIYVGISSNCDTPLVRGGVAEFDQATGHKLNTFYAVPTGHVGGSVWSSVAVDGSGNVYATTGNGADNATQVYHTVAILKLSPALKLLASFQVPKAKIVGDGDFGGSPTLFTATINGKTVPMVGACNKNGIYYGLGPGPVPGGRGVRRPPPVHGRPGDDHRQQDLPGLGRAAQPGYRSDRMAHRAAERGPDEPDHQRQRGHRRRHLRQHQAAEPNVPS